ncbi:helix-turn-helix domain-containing protein [Cupriavidus basilensis]|uniref:helix-turn-helix domain-containing protein n=1 Tax=Cupriavidus basilensis TaxID=68895 RepID=UPI0039F6E0DC
MLTSSRCQDGQALSMLARLTAREQQVLRWLAHGKTDREIAGMLGISARTVQKHLQHVYVKLGVENRTAAVMRGLELDPGPAIGRTEIVAGPMPDACQAP